MSKMGGKGETTMKTLQITRFGDATVLSVEEAPPPELGADDVLIRVVASGFNPIESKIRSGAMARALGRPLPVTLGWECAGVVERTGARVRRFKPGDAVFTYAPFTRGGTHAELVAVDAAHVALKPSSLSFERAAAVPLTAQAAATVLAAGRVTRGDKVLIHGAGGAVGHWLVQFAKERGATIAATALDDRVQAVRALGADEVIDYRLRRFEELGRFAAVFDLVGGETQERSWALLQPGGRLVSTTIAPARGTRQSRRRRGHFRLHAAKRRGPRRNRPAYRPPRFGAARRNPARAVRGGSPSPRASGDRRPQDGAAHRRVLDRRAFVTGRGRLGRR